MEKTCIECNITRKSSSFYSNKQSICRSCIIRRRKESDRKINIVHMMKRKCNECDEIKDVNNFYKERGYYRSVCKICCRNKGELEETITRILRKSKESEEIYNKLLHEVHLIENKFKVIKI